MLYIIICIILCIIPYVILYSIYKRDSYVPYYDFTLTQHLLLLWYPIVYMHYLTQPQYSTTVHNTSPSVIIHCLTLHPLADLTQYHYCTAIQQTYLTHHMYFLLHSLLTISTSYNLYH